MRFPNVLSAAIALLSVSTSSLSAGLPFHPNFVQPVNTHFEINGAPYYYAGTNAYWFSFLTNLSDVSSAMDQAVANGLRVIRTWAFNSVNVTQIPGGLPLYNSDPASPDNIYYQSWKNGVPTINLGSNGLPRLDKVVKLAEEKGIKLVLTLTNNWYVCLPSQTHPSQTR